MILSSVFSHFTGRFIDIIIKGFFFQPLIEVGTFIGDIVGFNHQYFFRQTVKAWVGKQLGRLFEIENGEPQLAVPFIDTCAAPDDLFKFSHRLDVLIQYDQLAGLRINAGCHQL